MWTECANIVGGRGILFGRRLTRLSFHCKSSWQLRYKFHNGLPVGDSPPPPPPPPPPTAAAAAASPQVMEGSYGHHAIRQYAAHNGCQAMLEACMEGLGRRIHLQATNESLPRRRLLADLGSADGSSSLRTLQTALSSLEFHAKGTPLQIVFEEHPSSDQHKLMTTLEENKEWFDSKNMHYSILMKSFYESLFEPESMDLILSYTSLQWLDTADKSNNPFEFWKYLDQSSYYHTVSLPRRDTFVSVQEPQAPATLRNKWQIMARQHLARFFVLRAQELRPGAEMMLMMVAYPHEFIRPPGESPCALTLALQRCLEEQSVRPQIFERAIVPYYLRQPEEIREAFDCACEQGALLELVDIQHYETFTPTDTPEANLGAAQLFGSIHLGLVRAAGASAEEVAAVEEKLPGIFQELYGPNGGFRGVFLALVLRKRTRKPWA